MTDNPTEQVMSALTNELSNQGVLIQSQTDTSTTYIGLGNKKIATIIHPFYAEGETVDINAETQRLLEDAKVQIRSYVE